MQAIEWSEHMALGVPAMDAAHRALLAQLACLAEAGGDAFMLGYTALTTTLEREFREEEVLMARIHYPPRQLHREQHARVLNGLRHADPFMRQGDTGPGREVVQILPRWFLIHLSTLDLELSVALELSGAHHQRPPDVALRAELARMLYQNRME
ncbi:hemerythrin [Oxalobacteraceae bacterium GrIS 1.11]